jgi:hypothetical protein
MLMCESGTTHRRISSMRRPQQDEYCNRRGIDYEVVLRRLRHRIALITRGSYQPRHPSKAVQVHLLNSQVILLAHYLEHHRPMEQSLPLYHLALPKVYSLPPLRHHAYDHINPHHRLAPRIHRVASRVYPLAHLPLLMDERLLRMVWHWAHRPRVFLTSLLALLRGMRTPWPNI